MERNPFQMSQWQRVSRKKEALLGLRIRGETSIMMMKFDDYNFNNYYT